MVHIPYLASVYAETLRIRTADTVMRSTTFAPIQLGKWLIPRGKTIAINLYNLMNDPEVWNQGGPEDPHPLREFWDERFLAYTDGGGSSNRVTGPPKLPPPAPGPASASAPAPVPAEPRFSTDHLRGVYIPYGGGLNECPGRIFAKQSILYAVAALLRGFDVDLTGAQAPEMDWKMYGIGILGQKGRVGFRIRRRE